MKKPSLLATITAAAAVLLCPTTARCQAAGDTPVCPPIVSDTSEAPDLKEWAAKAEALCREWYPRYARVIGAEESRLPRQIKIVYDKDYQGVAACAGDLIMVSPKWVRDHPDDLGCILHELTHFQQAYPKYDPVWLVEGISDYARWFLFEPEDKRPNPNPGKASARDSYRTTGHFLDYLTRKYDKDVVRKLSRALKESRYSEDYFQELTGKSLDALNEEWLASLRDAQAKRQAQKAEK